MDWISTKEQLPYPNQRVLGWIMLDLETTAFRPVKYRGYPVALFYKWDLASKKAKTDWTMMWNGEPLPQGNLVSHWMPFDDIDPYFEKEK
jgi:hypothetical protein